MIAAFLCIVCAVWAFIVGLIVAAVTGGAPFNGASMVGVLLVILGMYLGVHATPKEARR